MFLQGNIIEGDFDSSMNEFILQKVKHFNTQSVLTEVQIKSIYHYLKLHRNEDGHIITLYDQMPLRLSLEESELLIEDMEKIMDLYK